MRTQGPESSQLVVTGSSAGGIEALSVLLSGLPAGFAAPIVVAQHLDPRVPSNLASILSKRTKLRVVSVLDTAALEPATVYVVQADRHVEITDGSVRVRPGTAESRPKPSVDHLFISAAEAFGERLVAVVLTGLGRDGTNGARAVKRLGGTVIIEDPLTASFPSMPASLEPETVDIVAPLAQIAAELSDLVGESVDVPDDSPQFIELLAIVRAASSIDFSHYKPATIRRRLARQIRLSGHRTISDYLAFIAAEPSEIQRLVNNFLIKVTEFFRDRELFDTLGNTIVPELVAAARQSGLTELRLWSAGCATGEEAYSLAILCAEAVRSSGESLSVRIFATDIDEASIAFGRRGIYPPASIATIAPELVERYFTPIDGGWEVSKAIRTMTIFGQHDLGQRAPFPRIDLALCRNVLIYFSKELQARTLQIFAFSLRNGGYLALGKAETASPLADSFAIVNPVLRIFRRYGERVTIPPAQIQRPLLVRDAERARSTVAALESAKRDDRLTINERMGSFLTAASIGVILVDRNYDIISINASARTMFNINGVAVGEDLVHLAPPEAANQLRALLDSALRNQEPTAGGEEIEVRSDGTDAPQYLTLSCYPEAGTGRTVTGAVLLAVDVTELARSRHDSLHAMRNANRELEALRSSEAHARERQRLLVQANTVLAQANSDLRAENDALIINTEEAEAATEEIETLNEEMQATNEELETLNEEFQATIEELNTTNDEHEARARETYDALQAKDVEIATARLGAAALVSIVDRLNVALAAVAPDGTIVATNEMFRRIQAGARDNSVQIDDDTGATISLNVVLRRAGEGHEFGFTYRAIAADQARSVYAGRTRPLGGESGAHGMIELTPQ